MGGVKGGSGRSQIKALAPIRIHGPLDDACHAALPRIYHNYSEWVWKIKNPAFGETNGGGNYGREI